MDPQFCQSLFDVDGQVIVITGGGGVLCSTLARALARAGARVALLDVRPEAAEAVAAEIRAAGGEALALGADVLSKESLEAAAAQVAAPGAGWTPSSTAPAATAANPPPRRTCRSLNCPRKRSSSCSTSISSVP